MSAASAPRGLRVEPGTDSIALSWLTVPTAVGYRIYFGGGLPVRRCSPHVEVAETSGELGGLPVASPFYLAVSALLADGSEGPLSEPVSTRTLEPPLQPPAYVAAQPGANCLEIVWNAVSGSTGYTVYYAASSPVTHASTAVPVAASGAGPTRTLRIEGLFNDPTYFVAVCATAADGTESALSAEASGTPTAAADGTSD